MRYSGRSRFSLIGVLLGLAVLCCAVARAADPNPPTLRSTRGAWPITRQWTPAEAKQYARWMNHLYMSRIEGDAEQRMAKIERMLTDPEMNLLLNPAFLGEGANPQLPKRILRRAHSMMDCAKLTIFLPAYYAYRRGLPWMVTYVRSGGGDVRTADANIPTGTRSNFDTGGLDAFFTHMLQGFSSGNYRVEPNGPRSELSDTVPVAIDPEHLLPGCVNYTDGHCLLLARITGYGELYFLNASTMADGNIYTYNGLNVVTGITPKGSEDPDNPWKGCFQGLRVFRYPIAVTDKNGRVVNVRRRTDAEMQPFGYSLEQYESVSAIINRKPLEVDGLHPRSLHDFIRLRMRRVDTIAPAAFLDAYAEELREMWVLREEFVQAAWKEVQENGYITFPHNKPEDNIFQAHGRWETWSSPSSDVDRRNKYFYLLEWLDYAIRWYGLAPDMVDLTGLEGHASIRTQADLLDALLARKRRLFNAHAFAYHNSKGEPVELTLTQVEHRLFDLSFDPNHPPELRWGAPEGSAERATAPVTWTPLPNGERVPMEKAYELQAYYRTVGHRETEPSYLTGMFTSGYPVRDKLEPFLEFIWGDVDEMTPELQAYFGEERTPEDEETGIEAAEAPVDLDSDAAALFSPWRDPEETP